jgi:hypothetical protein
MSKTDDEAERFRTMAVIVNAMTEPDLVTLLGGRRARPDPDR